MEAEDVAMVVAPWFQGFEARLVAVEAEVARVVAGVVERQAEQEQAYRLHVLTEAARLGIKAVELARARRLVGGGDEAPGGAD